MRWSNPHEEADEGEGRRILIPVLGEKNVIPPRGFRGFQAADFSSWDRTWDSAEIKRLIEDISGLLGLPPQVPVSEKTKTSARKALPVQSYDTMATGGNPRRKKTSPTRKASATRAVHSTAALRTVGERRHGGQQSIEADRKKRAD